MLDLGQPVGVGVRGCDSVKRERVVGSTCKKSKKVKDPKQGANVRNGAV
jgi:hypothetical protein